MAEYQYTDVDGDRLAVFGADIPDKGKGVNVRTDPRGCSVPAADAPDLARAVLAAAGDTVEAEPPVHAASPEGVTPCGLGTRDVTVAALIAEVSCVECLRAIAIEKGEQIADLVRERDRARDARHDPAACTDVGCLACRVAQLERDMGRREQHARHLDEADARITERIGAAEFRLDALEIAQRETTQSGGAEHVQVAGGSAPAPCQVTGWNSAVFIDMVCHHDSGHTGPHYNPASGGWEWDENGHVTALDGRTPTHDLDTTVCLTCARLVAYSATDSDGECLHADRPATQVDPQLCPQCGPHEAHQAHPVDQPHEAEGDES